MIRSLLALLFLLFAIGTVCAKDTIICRVNDPTETPLNIRDQPGGHAFGTVQNGTYLEAAGHEGLRAKGWMQVILSDSNWGAPGRLTGWVFGAYISCKVEKQDQDTEEVALFTTWTKMDYSDETPVITAVACRRNWNWVSDRNTCMEQLPAKIELTDLGAPALRAEGLDMYGQMVALVDETAKNLDFLVHPPTARATLASKCFLSREVDGPLVLVKKPTLSKALLVSLDERERALLEEAVSGGRFETGVTLKGDFNGDKDIDSIASLSLPRPEGTDESANGLYLAIAIWSGREPEVVAFNLHAPYFPRESRCFDLDENGAPEILLAIGGEMERSYRYIEWSGDHFIPVGFGISGGD